MISLENFHRFVGAMIREHEANRHKGDAIDYEFAELINECGIHLLKLMYATRRLGVPHQRGLSYRKARILEYSADVANYAAFIATKAQALDIETLAYRQSESDYAETEFGKAEKLRELASIK